MLEAYMEQLKNKDIDALDSIYIETNKLVFSVCLAHMRDYMLAEDMMADTYVKIRKYISKYKSGSNALAWITTIAKNTCLNEIKVRKRVKYLDSELIDVEYPSSYRNQETPLLDLAIQILKDKELKILLLHIVEKKSLIEISTLYHMPEGTTRWKYNNALKKIRKYLEKSNQNEDNE